MRKILPYLAYLTIIVAFGLVALVTFWLVYPYKPLELSNVKLNKTEVSRGEHVLVSADYCKNIKKPATLFVSFVDGIIYNTQPQIMDLETGCHKANLSIYIPKALPTGKFLLKGVFRYKVNPIRTIEVNHLTGDFEIIK
jgi:hypothetical protein